MWIISIKKDHCEFTEEQTYQAFHKYKEYWKQYWYNQGWGLFYLLLCWSHTIHWHKYLKLRAKSISILLKLHYSKRVNRELAGPNKNSRRRNEFQEIKIQRLIIWFKLIQNCCLWSKSLKSQWEKQRRALQKFRFYFVKNRIAVLIT